MATRTEWRGTRHRRTQSLSTRILYKSAVPRSVWQILALLSADIFFLIPALSNTVFSGVPDHWGLAQALFSKLSWSGDPSMGFYLKHPNWHAGSWAGAQVDMISLHDMKDFDGWKDITEETFRGLAKHCIRELPEGCQCSLCQKCREVNEEKQPPKNGYLMEIEKFQKTAKDEDIHSRQGVEVDFTQNMINYNKELSQQVVPTSAMERMPSEILDIVFSQVDRESLPACVYLSSRIYPVVVKRLYHRVQLMSDASTRNFAETLVSRPILKDHVRQLLTVVNPHWESVAVLHNILKQLPFLTLLEIGPTWITYGDLPYWEYPFKLEGLKWGFIKDEAAKRFIGSQKHLTSEVVYWALPPYFDDNGKTIESLLEHRSIHHAGWNLWMWGAPQYFGANSSFDPHGGDESD
ncbi:13069_t:CDS:2 [Acaulospora colombiana]|uniref:13069_t:CDS:1 n=1 Tax=Acaulospora colombiana TaxID=27376 RepID=A0ACA9NM65_9GLOM|nr:13069_t:CDS:2 [Acaulospora colombiana]